MKKSLLMGAVVGSLLMFNQPKKKMKQTKKRKNKLQKQSRRKNR